MDAVRAWFARERARRPWLDHLARAGSTYTKSNGNHLGAAITYFSFLALFPLILLSISVAGFVLSGHPELFADLHRLIKENIPGGFGATVGKAVDSAVDNRGTVGIIGVVGLAYAGLGWIGNLRTAIQAIWNHPVAEENWIAAKARDLLALVGLGLAALISLALTAGGTAATDVLVRALNLEHATGVGVGTRIVGLIVAVAADTLIFAWMLVRLPRSPIPTRAVLKGALFAAVGFEILKIGASYYISRVAQSPSAGVFGGIIGLLVWVNLVSRFVLFATAWTATDPGMEELARREHESESADETAEPVSGEDGTRPPAPSGALIAVGLLGVGMISGAVSVLALRRRVGRT